jgi:hypothetical protein
MKKVKQIVKQNVKSTRFDVRNCSSLLGSGIIRRAPVAQRIEQRFPNSRLGMPISGFRYKLELLC